MFKIPERRMASASMYTTVASSVGRYATRSEGLDPPRARYRWTPTVRATQRTPNKTANCQGWKRNLTNGRLHRRGGFCHAGCFPKIEIGPQIEHHLPELGEIQRLRAIADGLLRRRMHFHQQTIGADSDCGSGEGGDQAALP